MLPIQPKALMPSTLALQYLTHKKMIPKVDTYWADRALVEYSLQKQRKQNRQNRQAELS